MTSSEKFTRTGNVHAQSYTRIFQYPQAGRERILTPATSPEGKYTHQILMSQVEMHYKCTIEESLPDYL